MRSVVIGLLSVLVTACRPSARDVVPAERPCRALEAVDSLMWERPDSAFAMLLKFAASPAADSLDAFNGHYCQLLISELLYKNDYAQSNREGLLQAVDYLDSVGDPFMDARAHYIKGVGFYEEDSLVMACREYVKALRVMEDHYRKEELVENKARFMTYAFNRLGDMFSLHFMTESAIICYTNSYAYSVISPISQYSVSSALYRIGMQYDMNDDVEKANYYYSQALEEIPDTNHVFYRDIVSSQALLTYQSTHRSEEAIQRLKQMIALTEDDDEKLTRCLVIGNLFYEEGHYDSAVLYLEPVFEGKEDVVSRIQAAQYLREIYDSLGISERSDEYTRFLTQQKKSEGQNMVLVSQLKDVFNDYLKIQQEKLAEEARKESVRKTTGIILTAFMILGCVLIVLVKQKNKTRQSALSGRLKKSNQELRELKDRMKQYHGMETRTGSVVSFADEPVCRLVMERVREGGFKSQMDCEIYKHYALNKQQLLDLRTVVNRHFSGFSARLRDTYPELTHADLDYCCLYLLGLSDADVSALMQKAYSTVSQRSRKIKSVLKSDAPLSIALRNVAGDDLVH